MSYNIVLNIKLIPNVLFIYSLCHGQVYKKVCLKL